MVAFVNHSKPRKIRKSKRPTLAMSVTPKRSARQPKMTAAEALEFNRFSIMNATNVFAALQDGGRCKGTCEPYRDVFTFGRWKALGCHVRKGEHGIKIPVIITKEVVSDDPDQPVRVVKFDRFTTVFCACQVEGEYVVDLQAMGAA